MNKIHIEAQNDFLESIASAAPMKALAELVWNGLDAGSNRVDIQFTTNKLEGLEKIAVKDYGTGINYDELSILFGNLGNSWKRTTSRQQGRSLHGKSGQGRFKAFALGNHVEWNTVYAKNGQHLRYKVAGNYDNLRSLQSTEPVMLSGGTSGTEVTITEITKSLGTLLNDAAHEDIATLFAAYLSQYPEIMINYNGKPVSPDKLQYAKKDIPLINISVSSGQTVNAILSVVEWNIPIRRAIYLCDSNGVSLHEVESSNQIRAPNFQFTAYVKCDHFRELDKGNNLILDEAHPDVESILKPAKQALKTYFRGRLAERQRNTIERWKNEQIYPYADSYITDPVEESERQVFDILAVNVESYLPAFESADLTSKKFMFRLLAQALRENPDSVQKIITEVLNLKKEEQEDLATLLNNTSLSNIISSSKIVSNRLSFLLALDNLLFDKATKDRLLERDQLHKILENEAWIFDEGFSLSGSEKRLEEVLQIHIGKLGDRGSDAVLLEGGKQGRIDLMLSRVVRPRHDERDHLVVELKRPSQMITSEVLSQIEGYAIAVASDPRFHSEKTHWRFIVVSNEMDEHARRKTQQRHRPRGLVFDDSELNVEVWAYAWAEIIANATTRLQFINDTLKFQASRDSSRAYLQKTHNKFIPMDIPDQEISDLGQS
jgi:hypothetical protein